jgi:hypothetical protein
MYRKEMVSIHKIETNAVTIAVSLMVIPVNV